MDFNKQLDELEPQVEQLKASVAAAAEENQEQLQQRIDKAQADTDRALAEARQQVSAAADKAQSSWEQTRSEAKARLDELKAKAAAPRGPGRRRLGRSGRRVGRSGRLRRDRQRRLGARERPGGDPRTPSTPASPPTKRPLRWSSVEQTAGLGNIPEPGRFAVRVCQ